LYNIAQELRYHLHHGGCLKSLRFVIPTKKFGIPKWNQWS